MSGIVFSKETDRRIEFDRLLCNSRKKEGGLIYTEGDFRHYIFRLGLLDYESRILPKQTGKPYKPYCFIRGENVLCRCEPIGEAV